MGGVAVLGEVLQAAQQRGVVVGTKSFGGRLLVQRDAALPGGSLSGLDHEVDLLETLWDTGWRTGNRGQNKDDKKTEDREKEMDDRGHWTKNGGREWKIKAGDKDWRIDNRKQKTRRRTNDRS